MGFFIFCLGAIIGSFLNVVSLRFNTGRSFVSGRSGCFSCSKQLNWYENIPLISFVFLKGRCSGCKTKISYQYPLVELSTALLFLLGFLKFQYLLEDNVQSFIVSYFFYLTPAVFLILIFLYDLRHKIIPNEFVYPFIFVSGIFMFFDQGFFITPLILDLLAGPILFLPFFLLWFISGGRWIGFADGKLAWGMGWYLGLFNGISAVMFAFWIGAIWGVTLIILQKLMLASFDKGITIESEVPFGPFLIVGFMIASFFPLDLLGLESLLSYYEIVF